jgi:hypothetical protein
MFDRAVSFNKIISITKGLRRKGNTYTEEAQAFFCCYPLPTLLSASTGRLYSICYTERRRTEREVRKGAAVITVWRGKLEPKKTTAKKSLVLFLMLFMIGEFL